MNFSVKQIARDGDVGILHRLGKESDIYNELRSRVNDLDEKGLSPLHYAARYYHVDMITELVTEMEAQIDRAGDDDMTPLHYAARSVTFICCSVTLINRHWELQISNN